MSQKGMRTFYGIDGSGRTDEFCIVEIDYDEVSQKFFWHKPRYFNNTLGDVTNLK
jgi:hypothetical protein